ncbi:MAG: molybdopterin molybdotransferase MoeA, partial [Actinomycetota bacterium]
MRTVAEARARVLDAVATLEEIELPVREARGFVVVRDLVAPHSIPSFDNSAMDGYAVIGSDVKAASEAAPVELEVVGEVRAGDAGDLKVEPGKAARIMTGAPLPAGADAIVPVEVTSEREGFVSISEASEVGQHVRPAGDDIEGGTTVVRAGMELGPGELAMLATLGLSPVTVYRRPRVAVLTTGDELVAPEDAPGPGQIRDSNSVALAALVAEAGGEVLPFGRVEDTRAAVLDA